MLTKQITLEEMRDLPLPSAAQLARFVEHLKNVHSWYKHLPLLDGDAFYVFLAPDAGECYPTQHPPLPFGNDAEGYRRAFGHLDYMWESDGYWLRDGGPPKRLPTQVEDECRFVLFPYVSYGFEWSMHEKALSVLHQRPGSELRQRLLDWEAADHRADEVWQRLPETERDELCGHDEPSESPVTAGQLEYLTLRGWAGAIHESLHMQEESKIWRALTKLQEILRPRSTGSDMELE
ncbi:MAG: hypothetical protein ACK47B_20630 [Armatimonadota bacterium]